MPASLGHTEPGQGLHPLLLAGAQLPLDVTGGDCPSAVCRLYLAAPSAPPGHPQAWGSTSTMASVLGL